MPCSNTALLIVPSQTNPLLLISKQYLATPTLHQSLQILSFASAHFSADCFSLLLPHFTQGFCPYRNSPLTATGPHLCRQIFPLPPPGQTECFSSQLVRFPSWPASTSPSFPSLSAPQPCLTNPLEAIPFIPVIPATIRLFPGVLIRRSSIGFPSPQFHSFSGPSLTNLFFSATYREPYRAAPLRFHAVLNHARLSRCNSPAWPFPGLAYPSILSRSLAVASASPFIRRRSSDAYLSVLSSSVSWLHPSTLYPGQGIPCPTSHNRTPSHPGVTFPWIAKRYFSLLLQFFSWVREELNSRGG